jgi:hypothetical protein
MQQGMGMHGQGMQGQSMQSQGTQGQGMQGQGMQGMEHGGMGGSNMQTPAAGGCAGVPMQGAGMQGQMPMQGQMIGAMGPGNVAAMPGPQMMQQMMMQGQGYMAEVPYEHIEGRIAYGHAELHINEAQMPTWTEFANALRANAKRIAEAKAAQAQGTNKSVADRLDDQERWLAVRLENVRALKPAYAKLYAVLDDKHRKMADELIVPYIGVR